MLDTLEGFLLFSTYGTTEIFQSHASDPWIFLAGLGGAEIFPQR
jgi:hypothetical protein